MPPLMCASVNDMYGPNFGKYANLSSDEIIKKVHEENNKCAEDNEKAQKDIKTNIVAGENNVINDEINLSNEARRPGWTNIRGTFPSNLGDTIYNRFQGNHKEYYSIEDEAIDILKQILLFLKIMCIILALLFLILITKINN